MRVRVEAHVGGHDVMRRALDRSIAGVHAIAAAFVVGLTNLSHRSSDPITASAGAVDEISDRERLDRAVALWGGDHGARRKALVGITHDGDLTVLFGELEHEIVLDGVGVLILVDEDVTEAVPP